MSSMRRSFSGNRLGTEIIRTHGVEEAERAALLARAIVRQHEDQRVVAHAGGFQKRDQPRQMPVGVVEHAGERRLQAGEDAPLVGAVLVPGFDAVVARGHLGFRRNDPQCLLPRHPPLALDVPAVREHLVIALDDIGGRLMRRVAGAEGDPGQPGQIRAIGDVVADEADRLVDQVRGQVIAVGKRPGRIDMGVVRYQFRRELIGLGVEETIEAVKAAPQRPAVERPGRTAFGQGRDMPFADHVVAIGMGFQHFRQRSGLARDLAAVAGIAGVEIGEAADTDRVMVAAGQKCRARGRAHRGGVKARVTQALGRKLVDARGLDRRAIAAEIGKADVVEQHYEDVGSPCRRLWRRRPPGF